MRFALLFGEQAAKTLDATPTPPSTADPDAAPMLAYAAGDARAFDTLYARNRQALYGYLRGSVASAVIADELFQETWSRVIAARARYQPQARFRTWLLRIAHNLLMDHYRAQRPELAGEEGEDAIALAEAPEHETPEALALTTENAVHLRRAIAVLPEAQREAVLLRFEEELSLEDIAVITGVGRETVKSRLRYALRKLRQELHHAG